MPLPALQADEVVVRVDYVALCGSDIKLFNGTYTAPHKYPIVLGHEWVGQVEDVSQSAAELWHVGDFVTGDCSLFCGRCANCAKNQNHCLHIQKRGITLDGACAEHIIVRSRHLHHCPVVSDARPFALTEPMAVVVQGLHNRIPTETLRSAKRALIIGAGGIGMMALLSLLDFKIPTITVADPVPEKLSLVSRLQLNDMTWTSVFPTEQDSFDLIVEASGSAQALQQALKVAAPGATIVCFGHQSLLELDGGIIVKKSLSLLGSIGGSGSFELAAQKIQSRTSLVLQLITRIVPLPQAEAFFRNYLNHEVNIKILIDLR